jgi:hypothetical protein
MLGNTSISEAPAGFFNSFAGIVSEESSEISKVLVEGRLRGPGRVKLASSRP